VTKDIFFAGIDFGTSGARIAICNYSKELVFSIDLKYKYELSNPQDWLSSLKGLFYKTPKEIRAKIQALSIAGTSGTILACNYEGSPIGKALPYNIFCDEQQTKLNFLSQDCSAIKESSSSLARALRLIDLNGEDILLRHQADWISGWLTKNWRYGEANNNFKLGWDEINKSWPLNFEKTKLKSTLPKVIESGAIWGNIHPLIAKELDLSNKLIIFAGTTDSNAAVLSVNPSEEDGLTILGSTIVLKKFVQKPIKSPGITNYKILGKWICGGSSNSGCNVISRFFSDSEIEELSKQINTSIESNLDLLPLLSPGERFPIYDPYLQPRLGPRPVSDSLYLQGLFEGFAKIEYLGWQSLTELSGSMPKRIITIGGGAINMQWRQIRKKLLNIPIISSKKPSALGAAFIALDSFLKN
tara:strand:- start:1909 stop:3150 length:1242 start_codon:yes stop_codon:yes gene_type:complete